MSTEPMTSIRVKFAPGAVEQMKSCLDLVTSMGGRLGLGLADGSTISYVVPTARKLEAQAALARMVAGGVEGLPTTLHEWLRTMLESMPDVPCERVGIAFTQNNAVSMSLFSIHQDREGPLDLGALFNHAAGACITLVRRQAADQGQGG